MPLRLYNTLSNTVETFQALDQDAARREGRRPRVTFYTCGPTVYDFAHIGNFRSFLAADTLRRWLESPLCDRADGALGPGAGGYEVRQVMNITDVGHMVDDAAADGGGEDKMEAARHRLLEQKKSGKLPPDAAKELDPADPYAIAEFYARAFVEDARLLGLRIVDDADRDPALMPRPTRYIRQMLEMILTLLERKHAYIAADGVAYFDTQSFPDYGRLSGNTLDKVRAGAGGRVSEATQSIKKHPADFMLWKPDPTHLMRWDPSKELGRAVPLKEGYPGWHIECSAMADGLLGEQIDLHSGGEDNIFPHHECEIAQSRCAHGTPAFARFWFHPRFLQVEGEKMSKSKGNFYTVGDLIKKGFDPAAIRLELVKTHYRSNANFTEQGLKDAVRIVERWRRFAESASAPTMLDMAALSETSRTAAAAFAAAMNDDLNVAAAIAAVNTWINKVERPTPDDVALMRTFDGVLGVLARRGAQASDAAPTEESARIDALVAARTTARATKNWPEADRIRKELDVLGVVVTDSPSGPTWAKKVGL
jgi:cysteinyl-tRNA synthetase